MIDTRPMEVLASYIAAMVSGALLLFGYQYFSDVKVRKALEVKEDQK